MHWQAVKPHSFATWAGAAAVFLAAFAFHAPALRGSFVHDDFPLIVYNQDLADPGAAAMLLKPAGYLNTLGLRGATRPLSLLSLMADRRLWKLSPAGYHLTNLVLHGTDSVLVFFLALVLLGRGSEARPWAAVAALAFALHPVQAEAVDIVSFRPDLLMAFFYLLGLLAFARVCAAVGFWKKALWAGLCAAAGVLAMLSKESAVTFPAALILYRALLGPRLSARARLGLAGAAVVVTLLAAGWLMRKWSAPFLHAAVYPSLTDAISPLQSRAAHVRTVVLTAGHYLKAFLWPSGLSIEYQMRLFGPRFAWQATAIVLALATIAVLFLIIRDRLFRFGLAFCLIALLPASNILPLPNLLADRYLYLPMAGFGLIVAAAARGLRGRRWAPALAAALLCAYAAQTAFANARFHDMIALNSAAVRVAPDNPRARYHLALAQINAKDFPAAAGQLEAAAALPSPFLKPQIRFFLGQCREQLGDIDGAEKSYREALRLVQDPEVYDRLGALHARRKDYAAAIGFFRRAVDLQPDYSDAWFHLLNAYEASGNKKALRRQTDKMARLFAQRHWALEGLSTYAP